MRGRGRIRPAVANVIAASNQSRPAQYESVSRYRFSFATEQGVATRVAARLGSNSLRGCEADRDALTCACGRITVQPSLTIFGAKTGSFSPRNLRPNDRCSSPLDWHAKSLRTVCRQLFFRVLLIVARQRTLLKPHPEGILAPSRKQHPCRKRPSNEPSHIYRTCRRSPTCSINSGTLRCCIRPAALQSSSQCRTRLQPVPSDSGPRAQRHRSGIHSRLSAGRHSRNARSPVHQLFRRSFWSMDRGLVRVCYHVWRVISIAA